MREILAAVAICVAVPALAYAAGQAGAKGATPAVAATNPAEMERLASVKFEPLADVAAAKRTLRRVTYKDAFGTSAMPGVVIEKMPNGDITMTMVAKNGQVRDTAKITQAEWDKLVAQDPMITVKPKVQLTAAEAKLICHSNSIVIEASDAGRTKRREASHCNKDTEAMLYGYAVAAIAVDNIPRCKDQKAADREASWQLTECLRDNRRRGN